MDVLSASWLDERIAWYPNEIIYRSASFPIQAVIITPLPTEPIRSTRRTWTGMATWTAFPATTAPRLAREYGGRRLGLYFSHHYHR